MKIPPFDPVWLAALRARSAQPPTHAREPLWAGGQLVGSILPQLGDEIGRWPSSPLHGQLLKREQTRAAEAAVWQVQGEVTYSLNSIADGLRNRHIGHVAHYWRGEQLAVQGPDGSPAGTVERGAVRPLGIATRAVHLVGLCGGAKPGVWVQQRAFNKANDPGQWDTLMGGMIAASDTLEQALHRETQEEAGLDVGALQGVAHGGRVRICRPTDDDAAHGSTPAIHLPGLGYMVEDIDWFSATVPDGLAPVNQDGEVEKFELLAPDELVTRLQNNEFTLEASMILVAALANCSAT